MREREVDGSGEAGNSSSLSIHNVVAAAEICISLRNEVVSKSKTVEKGTRGSQRGSLDVEGHMISVNSI